MNNEPAQTKLKETQGGPFKRETHVQLYRIITAIRQVFLT